MSYSNMTGGLRFAIVLMCLSITAGLTMLAHQMSDVQSKSIFQALANDNRAALVDRMGNYLLSLEGLAGFQAASNTASEADWARYVDSLSIGKTLPGLTGLGFIIPVNTADLPEFIASTRDDASGEITVRPQTLTDEKFVIRHIQPMSTNGPARGLDIGFEVSRRTAALAARDTGLPQITAPVVLVQGEVKEPEFLLLRPVYENGVIPDTLEERRATFIGWAYAPFIGSRLLNNITPSQTSMFTIKVVDAAADDALIFDDHSKADEPGGEYVTSHVIPMFGREWTVTLYSTPTFEQTQKHTASWITLLIGLALTWLLWASLQILSERERRVADLVAQQSRKLTDEEEQNRAIVQNSFFGIILLDGNGVIIRSNAAAGQILNLDPDETIGEDLCQFMPDKLISGEWELLRSAFNRYDCGRLIHIEMQRRVWRTTQGDIRQSILLRDISEELKGATALTKNEERWNLALSGADIGVFDIDLTTGESIVSDTWRRLMNAPSAADLPETQDYFFKSVHPDDLDRLKEADRACIAGIAPRSVSEIRIKSGDSSWRWMRSDAVVVERDIDGKALRMVGAQTDVTALRLAREALHRSEERFRLVISSAPVGMAILDEDGTLTDSNNALSQLIGETDVACPNLCLSAIFEPKEAESILTAISALNGDTQERYKGEHRIKHKDGTTRWGLIKVAWVLESNSERGMYVFQINDITQQKDAERIKTEFVATVSHELRTPLTSIKGALGLLETVMSDTPMPSAKRLIEIANGNTNRLIYLVNDILDLEKMIAGKLEFYIAEHSAVDLGVIAIEQIKPFADSENGNVNLILEDYVDDTKVMVDKDRLSQVLNNLLSNACKYAPSNTTVTMRIATDGDSLQYSVTDHGAGVPAEFHDRIFQPFSQADSSDTRQKGGTGLGLNISRLIVEKMGGKIGFHSKPGRATTFWFTVPLAPNQSGISREPTSHDNSTGKRHVLHIEDDCDFAEIIRISLASYAKVEASQTITDARIQLRNGTYDLVLIDWALTDGDASMIVNEIRHYQPSAHIVSLSSNDQSPGTKPVDLSLTKSREAVSKIVDCLRSIMIYTDAA